MHTRHILFALIGIAHVAALSLWAQPQGDAARPAPGAVFTFSAIRDFAPDDSGDVPYYVDKANNALAIDARVVEHRTRFARATRAFQEPSSTYDVTLTMLTEEDGESTYRLLVNGVVVATCVNAHIGKGSPLDMKPRKHRWSAILLRHGDTLAIESNTHTNGEIPENGGTAWARGRWRELELTQTSVARVRPPAGRLAIIADGNSPDPDDIGATAVMFGLLNKSGLNARLVHLSHSCDLNPFRNPGVQRINATDELRRQHKLHALCAEGIALYGPFPNLSASFNCRTHQAGAIDDLRKAIDASSEADPLWIIEAGEPDIIGYALQAAQRSRIPFVHVVSHHPANDNSGDFFTWAQILAFGVTEHQIGDQNVGLHNPIHLWDWAKGHAEPGIAWMWENLDYAERDGVVSFQTGKFDCSDAGMLYWWLTGADSGGNKHATPAEIRALLLRETLGSP